MADITAAELLVGSDEDFVINLYLACLGRWPDPEGMRNLLAKIAGSRAARIEAIIEVSVSPEAAQHGRPVVVPDPLLPAEPVRALQRQLALRSAYLRGLVEARQVAAPILPEELRPLLDEVRADMASLRQDMLQQAATTVEPRLHEVRAEMATLRRELRERQHEDVSAQPAGPDMADYVNDLLAVAEARMELRLRALEKRLP